MLMFSLTVIDHVRLESEHVAQNYTVHARAAERLVGLVSSLRITIAALLALATCGAVVALVFPVRSAEIASVAAATLAFVGFALYIVLGLEARLYAHRSFAHRLWLVSERYRSLLAEINEGTVDGPTVLRRRDELIHELYAMYEFAFGVDQAGHESARLPVLPHERAA
jgi:conflict system pore-forming effector with SLATT domain